MIGDRRLQVPAVWLLVAFGNLLCLPFQAGATDQEIDEACLKRFLREAPAAWKKAADSLDGVEEEISMTTKNEGKANSGFRTSKTQWQYKICWNPAQRRALVEYMTTDTKEARRVVRRAVSNPRYRFFVSRPESQNKYMFSKALPFDGQDPEAFLRGDQMRFACLLEAGFRLIMLNFTSINDIKSNAMFKLRQMRYLRDPGRGRIVRAGWEYVGPEDRPYFPSERVWFEMNPDRLWLAERSGWEIPLKGASGQQVVSYQAPQEEAPFPKKIEITSSVKSDTLSTHMERFYEFGLPSTCNRREDEFFLPYYGIPEAVLGSSPPKQWYKVLLVTLSFFSLIVALMLFKRRKTMSSLTTRAG